MNPFYLSASVYQIMFWAAFIIWLAPELVGLLFQRSRGDAKNHDQGSIFFLMVTKTAGLFFAFYLGDKVRSTGLSWVPQIWFFLGIGLMLAGMAFRWYSIRFLGSSFTRNVAVHPDQIVVVDGPYRYIRHPSYTGTLIATIGFGLALGNWLSLLCAVVSWAIGHSYRVVVEEKALATNLGKPYQDYMHRTRRFIPFLF